MKNSMEHLGGAHVMIWPLVVLVLIGLVVFAAVGIGVYVSLSGRGGRISSPRVRSLVSAFLWCLPVVAVLAIVVFRVLERHAPSLSRTPAVQKLETELGEPGAFEPLTSETASADKADSKDAGSEKMGSDKPANAAEVASGLPEWVNTPRVQTGDVTLVVLSSQQFATVEEAERNLLEEATETIQHDFHREHPYRGEWSVPADLVQSDAVRQRHVQKLVRQAGKNSFVVYRVHWQILLSPDLRKKLYAIWRDQVVEGRLWTLGSLLGLLTLLLATAAAYLRLDRESDGVYRLRLKLAAVALIVLGGLVTAAIL